MNKPVFPVGTKVRCVQSARSVGQLVKGGEYFVEDVLASGNVRLVGVSDTYWQPTRFVLVQQAIRVNARKGNVFYRILNWLRGTKMKLKHTNIGQRVQLKRDVILGFRCGDVGTIKAVSEGAYVVHFDTARDGWFSRALKIPDLHGLRVPPEDLRKVKR